MQSANTIKLDSCYSTPIIYLKVFSHYSQKYYLFLDPTANKKQNSSPSELLSEFGEPESVKEIADIMLEYGTSVIESNAVELLSEL